MVDTVLEAGSGALTFHAGDFPHIVTHTQGLVKALSDIKFDNMDNIDMSFRTQLINYTSNLKEVEWLKPPMLTKR